MDYTHGVMEESILDSGKITKWTTQEYLPGRMVVGILDLILMTKSMAWEPLFGPVVSDMKGNGRGDINME